MKRFYPVLFILLLSSIICCALQAQVEWQSNVEGVYTFSSTRAAHLNGDGVLDFVLGAGVEGEGSENGVLAYDGATGTVLWNVYSRDQIFGSPIFQDISGDGTVDVFIGGRLGEMMGINGATGEIIWEFFPQGDSITPGDFDIWQFYTPQWVPDQNGDGFSDLLVANGGDPTALLPNDPRPAGKMLVLNAANGETLAVAEVPDGQETYMSPLLVNFWEDEPEILFGTGGETQNGALYRASLADLMAGDLSEAVAIMSSETKGFIAPPSVADFNDDNVLDIVSHSYDGRITVLNGIDNSLIWEVNVENGETNASPGIGFFNDDNIPDVFSAYALGQAPSFTDFTQLIVDGSTGEVLWRDSIGLVQFCSPVIADVDGDGFDEVFFSSNEVVTGSPTYFTHEISLIDYNDANISTVYGPKGGGNVNSTPWLGDADADGALDLVYPFLSDSSLLVTPGGVEMIRHSLPYEAGVVSWGAYLGTDETGIFENPRSNCSMALNEIIVSVDPGACSANVSVTSTGCAGGNCAVEWSNGNTGSTSEFFALGAHYVKVTHPDGCVQVERFNIEGLPEALTAEVQTTAATCASDPDGFFRADWSGGTAPYLVSWNGVPSGGTTNAQLYIITTLAAGSYTFGLEDGEGCMFETEIVIEGPEIMDLSFEILPPSNQTSSDGAITLGEVTGGSPPYLITNEAGSPVFEGDVIGDLPTGIYTFDVKDQLDCIYTVNVDMTMTGIEEQEELSMDLAFLSNSLMHITVPYKLQEDEALKVYDMSGKLVYRLILKGLSDFNSLEVDLSTLRGGTYILQVPTERTPFNERFLLIK